MTPQIHPEFLERIAAIDWFHRCGQLDNLTINIPYFYVDSWQQADVLHQDTVWKEIHQLGQNSITDYICDNYKDSYNDDWNPLVIEAKPFVEAEVTPKIRAFAQAKGLHPSFLGSVRWEILHAIMEDAYRDANLPVRFFAELLTVYETGHFPCGWKGEDWEHGELAII